MPTNATKKTITVLVVDDDAMTRMSATMTLEDAGYVVITANDADGAILALNAHSQIAALFTDINMPGSMDGLALAHTTRRDWPAIHILLASGDVHPKAADMPTDGEFMLKPYAPGQILAYFNAWFAPSAA